MAIQAHQMGSKLQMRIVRLAMAMLENLHCDQLENSKGQNHNNVDSCALSTEPLVDGTNFSDKNADYKIIGTTFGSEEGGGHL